MTLLLDHYGRRGRPAGGRYRASGAARPECVPRLRQFVVTSRDLRDEVRGLHSDVDELRSLMDRLLAHHGLELPDEDTNGGWPHAERRRTCPPERLNRLEQAR